MITFIEVQPGVRARFVDASAKTLRTVLIVHGWKSGNPFVSGGTYAKIQDIVSELGFNSLLVSLSGHLPSDGDLKKVNRASHMSELKAAYAWLKQNGYIDESGPIGYGTSYGAYLISVLAGEEKFSDMVLRAPALYPDKGWSTPMARITDDSHLKDWRGIPHESRDNKALAGISRVSGQVTVFASEHDEFMPPQVAWSYWNAAHRGELVTLHDAAHQLTPAQTNEFLGAIRFLFQNLCL